MTFLAPVALGPFGLQIDTVDFHATWSGSGNINVGSLVALDIGLVTATNYTGGANSGLAHLQVATETSAANEQSFKYGIFAVYIANERGESAALAQTEKGRFRLVGLVDGLMTNDGAADSIAGDPVYAGASRVLHNNGDSSLVAAPVKVLGWLNETSAAADSATSRAVSFNGIGIGIAYTTT